LAAAGFVDEVVLITGPQRIGEGVPALGPHLRHTLERGFHHRATEPVGADQIDAYERSA
jgi:riboflavin biosynthesis pyrimidine reductase